ncbi:heme exporter protein CcmD [Pinirhizobacter sp.]|jgi:heme exporter protein D|uniref:heme exporter protein CcmD n=1 Tax=Pinirhizobacter sp. TaxID=2950432 RepID=UPI002F40C101
MNQFLQMGGYAFYVWTSYAVFAVVLLADYFAPVFRRRRNLRDVRARMARQGARRRNENA